MKVLKSPLWEEIDADPKAASAMIEALYKDRPFHFKGKTYRATWGLGGVDDVRIWEETGWDAPWWVVLVCIILACVLFTSLSCHTGLLACN